MPRGGENHAQGGEKIAQGGEKISRAVRARRTVYFFPPLANFSCTPLALIEFDNIKSLETKIRSQRIKKYYFSLRFVFCLF